MIDIVSGLTIDGFVVGECAHTGAMGKLFEVTGADAAIPLLMKVPRIGSADSAELLLGFEMEAMILPALHGPHVPRFVAAGAVTTAPYLVTEKIDGASLDRRAPGPMPAEEVARIGAAIADALRDVHAQGVVHLDLKPDNVIMRSDGIAVLVDFALAHHRHLPDLLAEEKRYAAGSAPYISPEQVLGNRSDARSDLFALGVLIYELATGELPFGTPATLAGLRDRLWIDPRPPSSVLPTVPDWLQEIILRCLEPEAGKRYQSAGHLAFDLRHPDQVKLTARAAKVVRAGVLSQVGRWWRARDFVALHTPQAEPAPVIMVAVDTTHPEDRRQPELQRVTRQILSLSEEFRLICVSIVPGGPEEHEKDAQVEHRIRLSNWAQPLGIATNRLSLHVIEAFDIGAALVAFARVNSVDLIVLGAPAPDEMTFAWWRSVASAVTANAPCSVHVVRA